MRLEARKKTHDLLLLFPAILLIIISTGVLYSIAPYVFPQHFLFVGIAFFAYYIFSRMSFSVLRAFSKYLYLGSVFLLAVPLIMGQITRGTMRWIQIGSIAIQPSELVRPFLLVFFAHYLASEELTTMRLIKSGFLIFLPVVLILIQPSLGVSALTMVAYIGVVLASTINKKYILVALGVILLLLPPVWFVMQPYQKARILSFIDPASDPLGAGYNSIQSTISVGSGKLLGRGLGKGVQTQLFFLPERHNDFVFASIAEELGFVGVTIVLFVIFMLLWRITSYLEYARSPVGRAYVSGFLLVIFAQTVFNIGMNMQLFPITGVPLPYVSAGGSSLTAAMIGLGIVHSSKR